MRSAIRALIKKLQLMFEGGCNSLWGVSTFKEANIESYLKLYLGVLSMN